MFGDQPSISATNERYMKRITYKKYRKLYKYKLLSNFEVEIPWLEKKTYGKVPGEWACIENGILKIKQGYAWDGPSGPSLDTKTFMRGSLVHDALYQLMSEKIIPLSYRKKADQEMRRINLFDGMNDFRAWYTYIAVRIFGFLYAKPKPKSKIIIAP
jgi:hypothetical protein